LFAIRLSPIYLFRVILNLILFMLEKTYILYKMICQKQATLIINFTDNLFFNPKNSSIFLQSSINELDLLLTDLTIKYD
ncbi:MAG: hypothetical protein KKA41_13225, partial [Proteobacteria bacterium]|nr:hypothetical protein [Pseudomonadota bacterium]